MSNSIHLKLLSTGWEWGREIVVCLLFNSLLTYIFFVLLQNVNFKASMLTSLLTIDKFHVLVIIYIEVNVTIQCTLDKYVEPQYSNRMSWLTLALLGIGWLHLLVSLWIR